MQASLQKICRPLSLFAALAGLMLSVPTLSAMAPKPTGVVVEYLDGKVVIQQNKQTSSATDPAKVEVSLVPGQSLKLRLRGNITTGYSWAIAGAVPANLVQLGKGNYIQDKSDGRVGMGGWSEFEFKAQSAGTGTLRLAYSRPWEKSVEPVATVVVQVTVSALASK